MQIVINTRKEHLIFLIISIAIIAGIGYVIAQAGNPPNPGHYASAIGAGTFGADIGETGCYVFPDDLNVSGDLKVLGSGGFTKIMGTRFHPQIPQRIHLILGFTGRIKLHENRIVVTDLQGNVYEVRNVNLTLCGTTFTNQDLVYKGDTPIHSCSDDCSNGQLEGSSENCRGKDDTNLFICDGIDACDHCGEAYINCMINDIECPDPNYSWYCITQTCVCDEGGTLQWYYDRLYIK